MQFFRISSEESDWLTEQPETAMGYQLVGDEFASPNSLTIVLGGQVAIIHQDLLDTGHVPVNLLQERWLLTGSLAARKRGFQTWFDALQPLPYPVKGLKVFPATALTFGSRTSALTAPQPAALTYGHLPFIGVTGSAEVYYRWEPWPNSRRITRNPNLVAAGTFAAPESERVFMPTGFSVVARLALPGLLPACFRWELQPPANTDVHCGAGVPMFGQSGGGVEVEFTKGFQNTGPFANPIAIPAL